MYSFNKINIPLTRVTAVVVRESLEELLSRVAETAEEDGAQTANVKSCGPFKLQLADVVANDGTAVLQEQVAGLSRVE